MDACSHAENGIFPFAVNTNNLSSSNIGYASQFIPLLPFVEQQGLYQQLYNVATSDGTFWLGAPYFLDNNPPLFGSPTSLQASMLSVLICPSDGGIPSAPLQSPASLHYYGITSYAGNISGISPSGNDGVIVNKQAGVAPVSIASIIDGTTNTIMFGERSMTEPNWTVWNSANPPPLFPFCLLAGAWTGVANELVAVGANNYPLNYTLPPTPSDGSSTRYSVYGSTHTGGANFVFCDGSVHFLSNGVNNTTGLLSALCTRANGEVVPGNAF